MPSVVRVFMQRCIVVRMMELVAAAAAIGCPVCYAVVSLGLFWCACVLVAHLCVLGVCGWLWVCLLFVVVIVCCVGSLSYG